MLIDRLINTLITTLFIVFGVAAFVMFVMMLIKLISTWSGFAVVFGFLGLWAIVYLTTPYD